MIKPSDLQLVRHSDGRLCEWMLYEPNDDPSCDTPLARGLSADKNPHTGEWVRPDLADYGRALEIMTKRYRPGKPLAITASWTEAGIIYHAMEDGRVWRWFAGEWHCDTTPLPLSAWRGDTATDGAL
jgi:hypothetical protein